MNMPQAPGYTYILTHHAADGIADVDIICLITKAVRRYMKSTVGSESTLSGIRSHMESLTEARCNELFKRK